MVFSSLGETGISYTRYGRLLHQSASTYSLSWPEPIASSGVHIGEGIRVQEGCYASGIVFNNLPENTRTKAKPHILDNIGCYLRGSVQRNDQM